jgi:hypothetical protein
MLNKFKKILLFLIFISPTACFADYGDWDYHGSGRDHPYSQYIDRRNYVGYADYAPIEPVYIDGPLNIATPVPVVATAPIPPLPGLPDQYIVNIPNNQEGFNSVVIKRSGEGFVGPQGEYYPEFPKVFQLRLKYGN